MAFLEAIVRVDEMPARYDAVLTACGFEQRSTYASQVLGLPSRKLQAAAVAFPDRQVLAYSSNKEYFSKNGFDFQVIEDEEFPKFMADWLSYTSDIAIDRTLLRVGIDISVLSRFRIATIIESLVRSAIPIEADFFYSKAEFRKPSNVISAIMSASPITPFFGGWTTKWTLPTVAVVGLGYEPDKAVGAFEFLEASDVWAFVPNSEEIRFLSAVQKANVSLLKRVNTRQRFDYEVEQPISLFRLLESVSYGLLQDSRPVLLPFGPKLFALCSCLVGAIHRDIPVWRVTSGTFEAPKDCRATGSPIMLRARFQSQSTVQSPQG